MGTNNIEYRTIDSGLIIPDVTRLNGEINTNPNLLHLEVKTMLESYRRGLAAIGVNEAGEAVAYARLIPLLDQLQADLLNLPEELRHIYELGTVFVSQLFRNQGIGRRVQEEALIHMHNGGDEKLVIGTTKTLMELRALGHITIPGIEFTPAHHLDYPHLAPLTCTCDPDFGCGFKYGSECPQRIAKTDVPVIVFQNGRIPTKEEVKQPDAIKCTMFVSNPAAARRFDQGLQEHFGSQDIFVAALKGVNYYG